MIDTKFISNVCNICNSTRITLDEHYDLPSCFEFILICPNHPAELHFDISIKDMFNLVDQE